MNADAERDQRRIPGDAMAVIAISAAMPLLMLAWLLLPTQALARGFFSGGIGIMCYLVGWLIQLRRHELGETVATIGAMTAVGAICIAWLPGYAHETITTAWRVTMLVNQGIMVLSWAILWRIRHRWLSRSVAGWSFMIAGLGYAVSLAANLFLRDPLLNAAQWGVQMPRGVVTRTFLVVADPVLGAALYLGLGVILLRWMNRDGGTSRA
jgi:hypothetical protein